MKGSDFTEYGDGTEPARKLTGDSIKTNMHRFNKIAPDHTVTNDEYFLTVRAK